MIGKMLLPLMKKYKSIFFSMMALSLLSFALLISIQSMLINLTDSYESYKNEYGSASVYIDTSLAHEQNFEILKETEGVSEYNTRIMLNTYLTTGEGDTVTAIMYSYRESDFYRRYPAGSRSDSALPNIEVEARYADYNNIRAGDTVTVSISGTDIKANVAQLVYTPETMYVAVSENFLPDNKHIGYIYISENELVKLYDIAKKDNLELYFGNTLMGIIEKGRLTHANEVLVNIKDGCDKTDVMNACADALEKSGIKVSRTMTDSETPSCSYMDSCLKSLNSAIIYIPVIFFIIMLVVNALLMNQVVQYMTHEIGIISALGIGKGHVLGLLSVFALVMSACSIALGCLLGYAFSLLMQYTFITVYLLPFCPITYDAGAAVLSVLATVGISQLAVLISSSRVFSITPKDAMISNETNKKRLPDGLDAFLSKFSTTFKLAISFLAQNPRKVLVSVFSIFAAVLMMTLAFTFYESISMCENQTHDRLAAYDVQLYYLGDSPDRFEQRLSRLEYIDDMERISYSETQTQTPDGEKEILRLQTAETDSPHVLIPDEKGISYQKSVEGKIIMPKTRAEVLGLREGDMLEINGNSLEIASLSYQYSNLKVFMTDECFENTADSQSCSFLVKTDNLRELEKFLTKQNDHCLVIESDASYDDFSSRYASLYILVYIVVAVAVFMAVTILIVMGQSSLIEQKRTLSVMRALGFSIKNISDIWAIQNICFMIPGIIAGIPTAMALEGIIFELASAKASIFPFISDPVPYILCVLFTIGVVLVSHAGSMRIVRKWNIADSTRARE